MFRQGFNRGVSPHQRFCEPEIQTVLDAAMEFERHQGLETERAERRLRVDALDGQPEDLGKVLLQFLF